MVTIAICEEDETICNLFQLALKAKGQKAHLKETANCHYLLVKPEEEKSRDILLLHKPQTVIGADYITLLNADQSIMVPDKKKSLLISYGMNPLATITASSFNADGEKTSFFCCLQRSIVTLKGKVLEPQEFPVTFSKPIPDLSAAMGFVALCLVLSFKPRDFLF